MRLLPRRRRAQAVRSKRKGATGSSEKRNGLVPDTALNEQPPQSWPWRADEQQGNGRLAEDALSHASREPSGDSGPPVGPHHDQVHPLGSAPVQDLGGRVPFHADVKDFEPGSSET